MPIRSNQKTPLTLKNAAQSLSSAVLNTPMQTLASRLMYVVLLIAFLVIGYLIGKVETLQKGAATAAVPAQNGQTAPAQPQAPTAPDQKTVLSKLKMGHLPADGKDNAKVTIVEFSDFQCPFCGRFYKDTLPQLRKDYIDSGKVKLYFRHFPLDFHPQAKPLAIAAECANDQGKFWQMHDTIFDNNDKVGTMTNDDYKKWAADLGLNTATFNSCVDAKNHADQIDADQKAGAEVGVSGTPTFYINGQQLVGAQPYASFKAVIDAELSK
jgi:protein-disulfide isomerase